MTSNNELQDTSLVQKLHLEALECNDSLVQKWIQYKKEYEELKTCLEEFPKELSAPIMMPLGSKVFVRAQLCNTNEVFVRYDEVFTKQTAFEAKAVCERHIKRCDGMIENLRKEKKLLNDNICARQEIINENTDEIKEIIEPYDEEKEIAWKVIHKQKVKEYKQQLLAEKENKMAEDCKKALDEFEKAGIKKQFTDKYGKSTYFDSLAVHRKWNPKDIINDSDDCSSSTDDEDMFGDDDEEDEDDIDDDEDEDSKLEIVFTNDVPETTGNLKQKSKKKFHLIVMFKLKNLNQDLKSISYVEKRKPKNLKYS